MAEPTLLLIESESRRGKRLLKPLEGIGVRLARAKSAEIAIQKLGKHKIDLMVVTLHPDDLSPLAGLARLREMPNTRDAKLLVISSAFGSKRTQLKPSCVRSGSITGCPSR